MDPEPPEASPSGAQAGSHRADCKKEPPSGTQPHKGAETSAEEHHRCAERRNWRIQNWINGVGALVTFIALCIAGAGVIIADAALDASWQAALASRQAADEAKRQADIAHEQLIANNRPWVSPKISLEALDLKDVGISVRFNLTIENSGKEPIFTPITDFALTIIGSSGGISGVWQKFEPMCRKTARERQSISRYSGGGTFIPPNEKWIQFRTESDTENKTWSQIRPEDHAFFILYGCVVYGFASIGGEHHTSFIYEIGMQPPDDETDLGAIGLGPPRTISGDDLAIRQEYVGTKAN